MALILRNALELYYYLNDEASGKLESITIYKNVFEIEKLFRF